SRTKHRRLVPIPADNTLKDLGRLPINSQSFQFKYVADQLIWYVWICKSTECLVQKPEHLPLIIGLLGIIICKLQKIESIVSSDHILPQFCKIVGNAGGLDCIG